MLMIELEDALNDLLPPGFAIETNKRGQIIILTNLRSDEEGELFPIVDEDIDPDMDPDFDPLDEEDIEDD